MQAEGKGEMCGIVGEARSNYRAACYPSLHFMQPNRLADHHYHTRYNLPLMFA